MRFLLRIIVIAFALWLTTMIVTGIQVTPYEDSTWGKIWTYLLIAVIFGVVNAIVGTLIKIVAFPIYMLTLGLVSVLVNGVLLWIVHWISGEFLRNNGAPFGLQIESFWIGVIAALVLGLITWLITLVVRPARKR